MPVSSAKRGQRNDMARGQPFTMRKLGHSKSVTRAKQINYIYAEQITRDNISIS